jgi:hypothetical protein
MESDISDFIGSGIILKPQTGFSPAKQFCDVREIDIDLTENPERRQADFLEKNGSKNVYRVGDVTVKCTFGDMDLGEMLDDLIGE